MAHWLSRPSGALDNWPSAPMGQWFQGSFGQFPQGQGPPGGNGPWPAVAGGDAKSNRPRKKASKIIKKLPMG